MPSYAGPPVASRPGEVTSTLRLLVYLVLAVVLIALDSRGGWLSQVRMQANLLIQPIWAVAGLPGRIGSQVRDNAATHAQLVEETRDLRNQLLVANARLTRLQTAALDNAQLRELLNVAERRGLDVQLAPILNIDLDPTRQRLLLDAGSREGVVLGQAVIDAGGLMGQVIEVTPLHSTVLLLTDPDHAVPVSVARNGVRLIVYGRGDRLELRDIPLSAGVQVGDEIVTSGLGGRFPAGFPVGKVSELHPDDTHAFLVGELTPAAKLDRGRDVLLLRAGKPLRVVPGAENGESGMGNGNGNGNAAASVNAPVTATPRTPAADGSNAVVDPARTTAGIGTAPRSQPTPAPAASGASGAQPAGVGTGDSGTRNGSSAPAPAGRAPTTAPTRGAASNDSRPQTSDSRPASTQGSRAAVNEQSGTGNRNASPSRSTAPADSRLPIPDSRPAPQETDQ
ncbi:MULTISPECIES: rod shape-determining protein MreC [Xanthomonas]|uniref:Cell shape-determining protein MreC n=1 Tax=Xanthomonas phaseoli pv. dieffenbachiae TaxID=92828 RepID=A0A1V9HF46_9XANT|nr:rod shape-determining protein MreC [Xanthomonas phaseoli]MBO9767180.1 rod shape-determining protein MreC [Xanthomonas phaseoli pv. dieffenbachiae]MBO9775104.1 rod shape-determining protein MreC [Xanthomonas phaseoli pv. dieffenbachiae]MBO9779414.1 rod shape-determining protein MreC [Xanthomonas phaseoli pv. dieffenbachiae]MBO9786543.1 rod shape-determining protein MreC [Xanthomonas phaseoli pv. dieffenbachiae]MBO9795462.1 rod shape-determining protein MreC [Xanthomonas phaseoli pv. dieffenb